MEAQRRHLVKLGALFGGALAAFGSTRAKAAPPSVLRHDIAIETPAGRCRSHLFLPADNGRHPAVLFLMDGFGIRPTLLAMAERVAADGYAVLVPDLLYRNGPYGPVDVARVFASGGDIRRTVAAQIGPPTTISLAVQDCAAFLDYIEAHPMTRENRVGVLGYCMSGGMALAAAGVYPDRLHACASFHGGDLATEAQDSPHCLAPRIKARVYIGIADKDPSCPPAMAGRLVEALTAAGLDYTCELYKGCRHGWNMADTRGYDRAGSERHYRALRILLDQSLRTR